MLKTFIAALLITSTSLVHASTGHGAIDAFMAGVDCKNSGGNERVKVSFECKDQKCDRAEKEIDFSQIESGHIKKGRSTYGDIVVVDQSNPEVMRLSYFLCRDGIFNETSISEVKISHLRVYEKKPVETFISTVYFAIGSSQNLIQTIFY